MKRYSLKTQMILLLTLIACQPSDLTPVDNADPITKRQDDKDDVDDDTDVCIGPEAPQVDRGMDDPMDGALNPALAVNLRYRLRIVERISPDDCDWVEVDTEGLVYRVDYTSRSELHVNIAMANADPMSAVSWCEVGLTLRLDAGDYLEQRIPLLVFDCVGKYSVDGEIQTINTQTYVNARVLIKPEIFNDELRLWFYKADGSIERMSLTRE